MKSYFFVGLILDFEFDESRRERVPRGVRRTTVDDVSEMSGQSVPLKGDVIAIDQTWVVLGRLWVAADPNIRSRGGHHHSLLLGARPEDEKHLKDYEMASLSQMVIATCQLYMQHERKRGRLELVK